MPRCEGWGIVPRLTLCVVDGPGDHGLVVPALAAPVVGGPDEAGASSGMADWCEDAEQAGGAVVLSVDQLPDVLDWSALLSSGTVRGGFMPVAGLTSAVPERLSRPDACRDGPRVWAGSS